MEILPKQERNLILTGDPNLEFDPYTYIWIYSYPDLAALNPEIAAHFNHILNHDNQKPANDGHGHDDHGPDHGDAGDHGLTQSGFTPSTARRRTSTSVAKSVAQERTRQTKGVQKQN